MYILLRGTKRFRLFSPADAQYAYTNGIISRVHKNGRINYQGFETNADGSEIGALMRQQASARTRFAGQKLENAEAALALGKPGAAERVQAAEEELDAALSDALDAGGDFEESYSDLDDEDGDDSDSDTGEEESKYERTAKRLKLSDGDDSNENPLNFSEIDLTEHAVDIEQFPLFEKVRELQCEIRAGEMLYLPAGWFHCVSSFNDNCVENGDFGGHLAVNYWMHPPDTEDYFKPYSSEYWAIDWKSRGPNPT